MTQTLKSNTQAYAVKLVLDAIMDTIKSADWMGAPAGPMYAALNAHGMSLDTFNQIMDTLVKLGKIRKQGQCYFPTAKS